MSNTERIKGTSIKKAFGEAGCNLLASDDGDTRLYDDHPDALQKGDVDEDGTAFSEVDLKRRVEIAEKNKDYRKDAQLFHESGNPYSHGTPDGRVFSDDSVMEGVDQKALDEHAARLAAKKAKSETTTDAWNDLDKKDKLQAEKKKANALGRILSAKRTLFDTLDTITIAGSYGTTHLNKNPNAWMIEEATKQLKVAFVLLEKALEPSK